MEEKIKYETWTDIIDKNNYFQTGVAILYRNPQINPSLDPTIYNLSNHVYSLEPGRNYLFDQKPIAFGFIAYIGHDVIEPLDSSLKSDLKNPKLDVNSTTYYQNYSRVQFRNYSINDKRQPRPRAEKKLEIDFYNELLINENNNLLKSESFFSEFKDDDDRIEKENLREYVDAFFEWIEERLHDLNPLEHYPRGLGGLSLSGANYVYKVFLGTHIHSRTKNKDFTAIFQNTILPDGWKRVEWKGRATDLTRFINHVFNSTIPISVINRYFKTEKDNLHPHNRAAKDKLEINELVNHAKTLRDR